MEVGTFEPTVETKKKRRRRPGLTGGGPNNGGKKRGGGGGGGGGNGGDNGSPDNQSSHEVEKFQPNKSRILMWFLLTAVLMTFGGLIGAYIVIASNGVLEWKPFSLPVQIWLSTVLILASSVTYVVAQKAVFQDNQQKAKNWLIATTIIGAAFISSQLLAWLTLEQRGVYMKSNPYAGFFYVLTAVHALHVLGGIIALGSIVLRVWNQNDTEEEFLKRKTFSQVVGWYWHFMGGLWLVLFLLLGFWK
jgi:cytochrome c oxidase subunit 3